MPKANIEKASNAIINPPTPSDPTSDVTRDGGEPLHKPPMADPEVTITDDTRIKPAAVPADTGRDHWRSGDAGPADEYPEQWRDDPMPEDAQGRLEWATRGTDTEARINAALRAEEARGNRKRRTLLDGLEKLRQEHRRNESDNN